MFSKIFNKFKKEKEATASDITPNLMTADPVSQDSVNLMAPDPVNEFPAQPVIEKPTEFVEQLGLENQMVDRVPNAPLPTINQTVAPVAPVSTGIDAFNMPIANTPESIIEKGITSKICLNCGTPNDILAKLCTSCGNNIN